MDDKFCEVEVGDLEDRWPCRELATWCTNAGTLVCTAHAADYRAGGAVVSPLPGRAS